MMNTIKLNIHAKEEKTEGDLYTFLQGPDFEEVWQVDGTCSFKILITIRKAK